jgi:hypothetical protein
MQPISFLVYLAHPAQTPFPAALIHNPQEAPSPQPLHSRRQNKPYFPLLFPHTGLMESSWVSGSRKTSSRVSGSRKMRLIHFCTKALSAPSRQIRSLLRASPAKSYLPRRLRGTSPRFLRLCAHCPRLGACARFRATYGHKRSVAALLRA